MSELGSFFIHRDGDDDDDEEDNESTVKGDDVKQQ